MMKTRILVCVILSALIMTAREASAQENKKAVPLAKKERVSNTYELRVMKVDSAADFLWFKREAEIRVKEYQEKITELKKNGPKQGKDIKEKFDRKILTLEKRNYDLRVRIEGSDTLVSGKWMPFKREFTHDMDELGVALRDMDQRSAR
jgi:hypothetical protein